MHFTDAYTVHASCSLNGLNVLQQTYRPRSSWLFLYHSKRNYISMLGLKLIHVNKKGYRNPSETSQSLAWPELRSLFSRRSLLEFCTQHCSMTAALCANFRNRLLLWISLSYLFLSFSNEIQVVRLQVEMDFREIAFTVMRPVSWI